MGIKDDFPLIIDQAAIAEITDKIPTVSSADLVNIMDYHDLDTALVIKALIEYMEERRCAPNFRLEIK